MGRVSLLGSNLSEPGASSCMHDPVVNHCQHVTSNFTNSVYILPLSKKYKSQVKAIQETNTFNMLHYTPVEAVGFAAWNISFFDP